MHIKMTICPQQNTVYEYPISFKQLLSTWDNGAQVVAARAGSIGNRLDRVVAKGLGGDLFVHIGHNLGGGKGAGNKGEDNKDLHDASDSKQLTRGSLRAHRAQSG